MDESIYIYKSFYCMDGDSNHKSATEVQSHSVARSQCWKTVLIWTGSLSAPDVNALSTTINPEKSLLWDPNQGPSSPSKELCLTSTALQTEKRTIHVHAQYMLSETQTAGLHKKMWLCWWWRGGRRQEVN